MLTDLITVINDDDLQYQQPDKIKIMLKPHQLKMVNKCIDLEQNTKSYHHNIIKTSMGVIADSPNSGKSYIILSIISIPYKKDLYYLNVFDHTSLFTIYNDLKYNLEYKKINILVIPYKLITKWKQYIKNTNISVEYICNNKQIQNIKYDKELIVLTANLHNKFVEITNNNKYLFSRVFYDNADTINIPNCKKINSCFYWFVTSNVENLLMPYKSIKFGVITNGIKNKGFIKESFVNLYYLHKYYQKRYCKFIFIKNSYLDIEKSINIQPPIINYISCKSNFKLIQSDIVNETVQILIYLGDIGQAIDTIDILKISESQLIKFITNDLNIKLHSKNTELLNLNLSESDKELINNEITYLNNTINEVINNINNVNIDPITFDPIKNIIITKCCKQLFDFESLIKYILISFEPKCPICRELITNDNLLIIKKNNEIFENNNMNSEMFNKYINIYLLLQHKIKSNARILIYADSIEIIESIKLVLINRDIEYLDLSGNKNIMMKNIDYYKLSENKQKILIVSNLILDNNISLENTTDIIFYDNYSDYITDKLISYAQCFNRLENLNIWKLIFEN